MKLFADNHLGMRKPPKTPYFYTPMSPAKTTAVYDTYWLFAAERQEIFFKRLELQGGPWTEDDILSVHKFTNAYRASDRTSQFLIKNVIYRKDLPDSHDEVFFRILLFKLFNKIETWNLLETEFGSITYEDYTFKRYDRVLSKAMNEGERIYSAAYIMPPGGKVFGKSLKHQNHLLLLKLMMDERVPDRLAQMRSMQDGFDCIKSFPMIGDFLAYQFISDVNYSTITDFSEMEFVVPGPGAQDGIKKCFEDLGGLSEPEIIKLMANRQDKEFERLGLSFQSLWGRPLQLIDCQNLFCEVDKYARVAHPEINGISGRTRIKQKFLPKLEPIDYYYPPKWHINEKVVKSQTSSY